MADYSDWQYAKPHVRAEEFVEKQQRMLDRLFSQYDLRVELAFLGHDPTQFEFALLPSNYVSRLYTYRDEVERAVRDLMVLDQQVKRFDPVRWGPFVEYDIMKVLG